MSQELLSDRFPALKGTYGDISWHKTRRTCTWLWGCAPAEKMWGCTQTAEGTGSRRPRCHWNWCTPAKKAHDPGQPWTASSPPDAISVAFWTVQLSLISLTPNGRKIGPLIQSNDVNCKCFPINLLSVVVTQAVTAVIELDEPSCELLLQYSICGGGGVKEWLIKGTLIGTTNQQIGQKSFTAP